MDSNDVRDAVERSALAAAFLMNTLGEILMFFPRNKIRNKIGIGTKLRFLLIVSIGNASL